LGRKLHETREVTLSLMADRDTKFVARTAPGQPQQQFARERQIGSAVWRAVLEHSGEWWKADDDDSRALDWSRPDRALVWYDILQDGLAFGALTQRWNDVRRICSWFKLGLTTENQRFRAKT
jgi:hypothetical protein